MRETTGPARAAIGWAAGVLLAGFGALNVLYLAHLAAGDRRDGLPGLYDYAAATWGDGLLLPVMVGCLVYAAKSLPPRPHERVVTAVAAACGAIIGAWTQVDWLRDDTPELNWTLPEPHRFNAAGWYHAAFLIAMCALTGALWTLTLRRAAHRTPHRSGAVPAAIAAALAAGILFCGLLVLDNAS